MTNSIKLYKELSIVVLKDDDTILTELTPEDIANMMEWKEFIMIWKDLINKFEIKRVKTFKPTELDNYILSRPKIERDRLNAIIKDRNSKWFQTKNVEHLIRIYDLKYGDNSDDSQTGMDKK